ncbi:uncharacterized protein L201_006358 [Kwoniella dendrophila CBS 6074]|uniref:Uncharacterized protein n=1 Tax=Kwoniella dendrophila CBS 6074 TaxID=1295534 RepID=A0AAX4K2T8_9TREE
MSVYTLFPDGTFVAPIEDKAMFLNVTKEAHGTSKATSDTYNVSRSDGKEISLLHGLFRKVRTGDPRAWYFYPSNISYSERRKDYKSAGYESELPDSFDPSTQPSTKRMEASFISLDDDDSFVKRPYKYGTASKEKHTFTLPGDPKITYTVWLEDDDQTEEAATTKK